VAITSVIEERESLIKGRCAVDGDVGDAACESSEGF
jgi:hypothetical protein